MGSHDEHHCVLHAARSFPGVTWGPRHCNERSRKNDGSGRSNVAVQDVYGRSNSRMGKQDVGDANVGGAPDILHRKVDGAEAVFFHHAKAITTQGSSAPNPRDSSSRIGRRNAGNVIRNDAGPTHKTDHPDGGNEQGQHGGHDGQNECPCHIECHQANAPTRQGEYSSGRQCQTPPVAIE